MKSYSYWLLAAALLVCAGCGREREKGGTALRNVYIVQPSDDGNSALREFSGVVEENSEVSLGFKTPGQISHIYVKEGQRVSPGQLLAKLDDADYQLGVKALQIQYDQVKDEVERAKRLFEKKSMTANDYEKAVAGLRQLAVQLEVNKNKLAYTSLYAPSSGVIEAVNFSKGEMVDAGTAVFTMLDVSQKSVVVDIPAAVYLRRDDIKEISCATGHNPEDVANLTLLSIVPKADSNQLYRMKLGFVSGGQGMTPGMNVRVSMRFDGDRGDKILIPQSALFKEGGKECVWILGNDSTVRKRVVSVNPSSAGETVEVISGLAPSDKVVRAGVRMLHEGEKVNVIGVPSETNVGGVL